MRVPLSWRNTLQGNYILISLLWWLRSKLKSFGDIQAFSPYLLCKGSVSRYSHSEVTHIYWRNTTWLNNYGPWEGQNIPEVQTAWAQHMPYPLQLPQPQPLGCGPPIALRTRQTLRDITWQQLATVLKTGSGIDRDSRDSFPTGASCVNISSFKWLHCLAFRLAHIYYAYSLWSLILPQSPHPLYFTLLSSFQVASFPWEQKTIVFADKQGTRALTFSWQLHIR